MKAIRKATLGLGCLALASLAVVSLLEEGQGNGGLQQQVRDNLENSGVQHPVTAVLLNFRFYDTWLELAVLWAGILACLAVRGSGDFRSALSSYRTNPMLGWLVNLVFPLTVLCSGYLLWLGKSTSGGAFQSGVVLGAGLVLLILTGRADLVFKRRNLLKLGLILGFLAFALAAAGPLIFGREMGQFDPAWAGGVILAVESFAAFSIGLSLPGLLAGLQVHSQERESSSLLREVADEEAG